MRKINITKDIELIVAEYVASIPEVFLGEAPFELVRTEFDFETAISDELDFGLAWDIVIPENEDVEEVIGYVELTRDYDLFVDIFE